MVDILSNPWGIFISVLSMVWGTNESALVAYSQRFLLLLPVLGVFFAALVTPIALITIVVRQKRREFTSALFVTWWDLGRAIFQFWGGIIKFLFYFSSWMVSFLRIMMTGLLLVVKDLLMLPIRLFSDLSFGYANPGVPWPAVIMMLTWTLLEALIFTYVMTPLVTDVLSGLAGQELAGLVLQVPLFLMFVVFVLGSYAVLYTYGLAIKAKNYGLIIFYAFVEFVVAIVEVVFLYREFVDALVPWFAQHAGEDFSLGIAGTIGIAFFVWLGIRAMTWFLFGATAVPTIMAIIQRSGLQLAPGTQDRKAKLTDENRVMFVYIHEAIEYMKKDMDWIHLKGDEVLSSFSIPPLQIIAACVNFCTLVISNYHLFELPFRSYKDILDARSLINHANKSINSQEEASR